MNKEVLFAQTLEKVKKTAREQGNCISKEQVEQAFAPLGFEKEQLALVYDYLEKHKIGIGEAPDAEELLSQEEKNYLSLYLEELEQMEQLTPGQMEAVSLSAMAGEVSAQRRLAEAYLPQVVDIAKLYSGQGIGLEDLIGEGNVALTIGVTMLGCLEKASEVPGMLGQMIMEAMEDYIAENAEADKRDRQLEKKVNKVADAARELAQDMGRKVTAGELADETKMSLKYIEEAMRLSGFKIEDLESGEEQ